MSTFKSIQTLKPETSGAGSSGSPLAKNSPTGKTGTFEFFDAVYPGE